MIEELPAVTGCPIRVLVADDHLVVRKGLRALLGAQNDMQLVGEAEDGCEALHLARELRPDVLLLDLAMPRLGGLDVAHALRESLPEIKVVVLSMLPVEAYGRRALECGAVSYLHKGCPAAEITAAIRGAREGGGATRSRDFPTRQSGDSHLVARSRT